MDDYCGLPFVTVFNGRMESMKIGEVVESLIQLKRDMDIYYPDDTSINLACNILERLPREKDVHEWIKENSK
jgi:hypothetical protein